MFEEETAEEKEVGLRIVVVDLSGGFRAGSYGNLVLYCWATAWRKIMGLNELIASTFKPDIEVYSELFSRCPFP